MILLCSFSFMNGSIFVNVKKIYKTWEYGIMVVFVTKNLVNVNQIHTKPVDFHLFSTLNLFQTRNWSRTYFQASMLASPLILGVNKSIKYFQPLTLTQAAGAGVKRPLDWNRIQLPSILKVTHRPTKLNADRPWSIFS